MRTIITEQQAAFFTKNGFIELQGISFQNESLFEILRSCLAKRFHIDPKMLEKKDPLEMYKEGRDLWREEATVLSLLTRKFAPLALALSGKNQLRVGCDQWIGAHTSWEKSHCCKDLFSIQGLSICMIISSLALSSHKQSTLGLFPVPSSPDSVLFFNPTILLDLPRLKSVPADLYLATYSLPTSVYIQNLQDPSTNSLKKVGYEFGDPLKNDFNPLVRH